MKVKRLKYAILTQTHSDGLNAHRFRKKRHPRPLPKHRQKPAGFRPRASQRGNDCGDASNFSRTLTREEGEEAPKREGEQCRDRRADRRG